MQPIKYTSSKCHNHNVIKQLIYSLTNKRPANVTITTLSKSLYTARLKHVQQMPQSQRYQTVYMQPNKYTSSKCHNYDVIKQLIYSLTNKRPANATIITLSNSLLVYAANQAHVQQMPQSRRYQTVNIQLNKQTTCKCHNHNAIKQFTSICSQSSTRPANATITTLSNS